MMGLKKIFLVLAFSAALVSIQAEELTKVAVVDMGRIVDAYFREAAGIKEITDLKKQYNVYVEKVKFEVADLKEKMIQARIDENRDQVRLLEKQIADKDRALKEYHSIMTEKIRKIKMANQVNNDFERRLQKVIQEVAISMGFSVVLEDSAYILWYDREDVDITGKVIERLSKR